MMIILFIKHQVESEKAGVISAVDRVDCVVIGSLYPRASTSYFWGPGHRKVTEEMREAEQEALGRIKKKGSVAFLDGFAVAHDDLMSL
ncbi:hypothetical protein NC653_001411 [Populus alba x Populus x berolinensis]|uniref:Uncharacterized protein n=1 Tax=Populus alba x Populus x berolinensis TaxID=444605 RepID=A0AAD6RLC8_9ROSI|nr:hypothetical protein NC653_001411 [Populus alba x Populus x berolinensis]